MGLLLPLPLTLHLDICHLLTIHVATPSSLPVSRHPSLSLTPHFLTQDLVVKLSAPYLSFFLSQPAWIPWFPCSWLSFVLFSSSFVPELLLQE